MPALFLCASGTLRKRCSQEFHATLDFPLKLLYLNELVRFAPCGGVRSAAREDIIMLSLLAFALQVSAVSTPPANTATMSISEVKAHNASLAPADPNFIKCRTIPVTGSLAKRGKACRTNLEWTKLQEDGNEHARAIADYSRSKPGGQ